MKILNFRGTAPLVQAMTAGSLDIALADGTVMAIIIVKGAPMTAVVPPEHDCLADDEHRRAL